ncbi:MAG: metal-dependent hydrolase [Patescibacteria group bacterium]
MFLDIGAGILIAILSSRIFGVDLSHLTVLVGVGFSLLPDLDVFVELAKRGRIGGRVQGHHRELTHFPLTFVPLAILILIYFGELWTTLFSLAVLVHFLHDSIGMGWGIMWLWPFSNKSYKFFSNKEGGFSKRFLVSWTPAELKTVIHNHGDDHWFKNYYLKLHPIAVFEFLVFIFSLAILYTII